MEKKNIKKEITFSDLSTSLKILVVFGWFLFVIYGLTFIYGVILGILEG